MKTYYITFRSVTYAQRGQRLLQQRGLDCLLQRTPRWMEQRGCGYCLRIRPADALEAMEALKQGRVPFSHVYAQSETGRVEALPV